MNNENYLEKLKESVSKEKKIISEITSISKNLEKIDIEERKIILSQIKSLKDFLKRTNQGIPAILEKMSLTKPLPFKIQSQPEKEIERKEIIQPIKTKKISLKKNVMKKKGLSNLEKETLKRLK